MSIKKSLIKNTGFNLASYFYLLIASFFSISVILGNLGKDLFGVYLFLGSVIPLAAVFDFGISTALVRKLSLPDIEEKDRVSVWKTSFGLFIAIGAVLALIVFGILLYATRTLSMFVNIDQTVLNWTILIVSINVFINHVNSHLLSLPQAEQRFDVFNSKTLLVGTGNTVLTAFLSGLFPNLAFIFLLQLLFHFVTLAYMTIYCYKIFPGKNFLPRINKDESKYLISFGLKNFVGTLASQIEAQFSKYALGGMVSASSITSYSIPQNIVAKGAGIISQVAQAFFPLGTSLLQKDRIKKLGRTVMVVQAVTLLSGLLAILLSFTIGEEFLMWWLKNAEVVAAAYPVLKILSFYFLLNSLTPIPSVLLQSLNKPQIPSLFAVATVLSEILLMFILVPKYHAEGAAIATLIAAIITVPSFLLVTWKLFKNEVHRLKA